MLTRRSLLSCAVSTLAACAPPDLAAKPPVRSLSAYRSETEMLAALARWRAQSPGPRESRHRSGSAAEGVAMIAAPPSPVAMAAPADESSPAGSESITNVQTAGVDEGGIVKQAGDHLLILRRGRLFTVRVGGDLLQPIAVVDAYAPGSDPQGAWYDELLVSGSTVVVVGYSYARGGTEIGLFELDTQGGLAYRATYHLRSFDYYSSRNYASRLIGNKLVFYSPTVLSPWPSEPDPASMMPALRRWQGQGTPPAFERILPATRVYRCDDDFEPGQPLALHTITSCELGGDEMRCESTAVLGPVGRVFYVSAGSVYVWTSPRSRGRRGVDAMVPLSAVFRIPLDGSAPGGLKAAGVPIDQMSFLEDQGGHLNVLLRESGPGEGMWGSEEVRGRAALLRVPLSAFGDGRDAAQPGHYRVLPEAPAHAAQNRFIGDWLLWGGAGPGRHATSVWAMRFAGAAGPVALAPGHGVERIEALGQHAVLVGNAGADLHFSSIRLGASAAAVEARHIQRGARQGETRSHGFFYRARGPHEGWLGLPVLGPVRRGEPASASVLYLRERDLHLSVLGSLWASAGSPRGDACRASCTDWYGNARPIFLGRRIFALMGYELVEGQLSERGPQERIEERRRISFAPGVPRRSDRYSPFD